MHRGRCGIHLQRTIKIKPPFDQQIWHTDFVPHISRKAHPSEANSPPQCHTPILSCCCRSSSLSQLSSRRCSCSSTLSCGGKRRAGGTGHWTLLCIGLYYGLGTTADDADERAERLIAQVGAYRHISSPTKQELTGEQMFFRSQVPRLVSTGMTKCSLALLAYEIKGWKAASFVSLVMMGLWSLGAPMIATVGCTPSYSGAWSPCSMTVSEDAARKRPSH